MAHKFNHFTVMSMVVGSSLAYDNMCDVTKTLRGTWWPCGLASLVSNHRHLCMGLSPKSDNS